MSEKTEDPTPKRMRDARKKGQVAKSKDFSQTAALLIGLFGLRSLGEDIGVAMVDVTGSSMRAASTVNVDDSWALVGHLGNVMHRVSFALLPWLVAIMVGTATITFLQVGPVFSMQAFSFDAKRIDPISGLKNLFGMKQWIELAKSIFKLLVVGAVVYVGAMAVLPIIPRLYRATPVQTLSAMKEMALGMSFRVAYAMVALSVLDLLYQRHRFFKDQKMTKDEVKREYKDAEGDPHTKGERERLRHEILEHNTLEDMRKASVLVVNPTHLAIALFFDEEGEQEAPSVLAKGQDELAKKMIQVAMEEGIPIMRDVPLAHGLYQLDLEEEIPEALYEAVAEVLRVAWELDQEDNPSEDKDESEDE